MSLSQIAFGPENALYALGVHGKYVQKEKKIQHTFVAKRYRTFTKIIGGLGVEGAAAAARKPDTQPSAPHHTDNLKTKAPNTTGSNHVYNTLELLMMGIMVPRNMLSKQ